MLFAGVYGRRRDRARLWIGMGEPAFLDRAAGERIDHKTSGRHFSSVDVAPRKRSCTFLYRIYSKENFAYTGRASCRFFIRKTPMRHRELRV
jgi:hypothetical protein